MSRIQKLEQAVKELYEAHDPGRAAEWADWLYDNHVFLVANYATELAKKYHANQELARAAGLLHDIADVKVRQRGEAHEAESLRLARQLMQAAGYDEADIKLAVDDAIRFHSCHGDERPATMEGKILAAADSLAHLKTDFYLYATWALGHHKTLPEIKAWTLEKLERDLLVKIQFDDERENARPDYELLKNLFSR